MYASSTYCKLRDELPFFDTQKVYSTPLIDINPKQCCNMPKKDE